MRPTGLGQGLYKDSIDYSVLSGDWLSAASTSAGASRQTFGGSGPLGIADKVAPNPQQRVECKPGGSEVRVSEVLGRLEGVGQVGGGALASLRPYAALPNS